jgi:hypothetical protein
MSFPAFLFLLPLIVVPIIIHLISRKKLKKIDFPSLLFIMKSEIKLIRWFRLKRLLLLIMRVGFVILLILAAAGFRIPFIFFDPSKTLIVDKSPSMEKTEVEDNNTLIVPTSSGIPQFLQYLKKCPSGILVTDAQKNGFAEILKEGKRFPGIIIRKAAFPPGNLGIIDASTGPSFEEEEFDLNFKILNEYKKKKKTSLILKIDDKIIRKKNMILKVGENALSFDLTLPKGFYRLSLELEDEKGFEFDNKFYFVVEVQEKKNICILSDVYPVRLIAALSPSYFNVKWVKENVDVKGGLFLACNANEKDKLFLLQSESPGIFCLQGETNTSISNKVPDRISTIVDESFLASLFYLENLSEIPVRYNCIITEGKPLVYFENGDPFLTKIKNHLILPISLEGSDLSLHPVFIPFLFSMISSLSNAKTHSNILLDEPVVIESSFEPQVISPKGHKYEPCLVGNNSYVFKETKECGFYKITEGKRISGLVAVNTHPSESKLESLSPEKIEYIFGKVGFSNGTTFFIVIALLCFVFSLFLERKI